MVNKCVLVAVPTAVPDDKAIACMERGAAIVINGWEPALDQCLDHILEMCPPPGLISLFLSGHTRKYGWVAVSPAIFGW